MKQLLVDGARKINVTLTEKQLEQFVLYGNLLKEWNGKMNLTTIVAPEEVARKHFLDSLTCLETGIFQKKNRVIDIGTGAGFPAIPLKIVCPDLEMVLLDSLQKRLTFLNEVIAQLGLQQMTLVHARAEDAGQDVCYREQFDITIARAVASMPVLCELCLPFVKLGGYFIAMKGSQGEEELSQSGRVISLLGGTTKQILTTPIDSHRIISIQKTKKTPKQYPRKAGIPSKKPLL